MRDAVYSGASVEEALSLASRGLGVPAGQLRYVVLDAGGDQRPARIAVLLEALRTLAAAEPETPRPSAARLERRPVRERIESWFEALSEEFDTALAVEIEEAPGELVVRLGPASLGPLGEAGLLPALELLLRRAFARDLEPLRLRVDFPGQREDRETRLRARTRELAAAVREDGVARSTGPLNSYERRLVHLVVEQHPGLESHSNGEGHERAVTIQRRDPAAES